MNEESLCSRKFWQRKKLPPPPLFYNMHSCTTLLVVICGVEPVLKSIQSTWFIATLVKFVL